MYSAWICTQQIQDTQYTTGIRMILCDQSLKAYFQGKHLKVIHRDISSAYSILIVDLRERGTYLQQKNGLNKSRAQKYKIFLNIS